MRNINLRNTDLLQFKKGGRMFYGGAQDFYPNLVKRWSGCGPTTAANLFAYLGLTSDDYKKVFPYSKVEYKTILEFMETTWDYITPGMGGINTTEKFAKGASGYLERNNIDLVPICFNIEGEKVDEDVIKNVKEFLENSLNQEVPVAFLNLDNGEVKNLQKWHWVLIMGISFEDGIDVVIYDEGDRLVIDLDLWLKTVRTSGGFVSFVKQNSFTGVQQ